jgi:predicted molibdopterin-dependent oxidoreductase YjgC
LGFALMTARFVRLGETERPRVAFQIDGRLVSACEGDTLLVAMLTNIGHVRKSEFGDGPRSGFCLMGACQDCWVWTTAGKRLRACSTPVAPDLQIVTERSEDAWPPRT